MYAEPKDSPWIHAPHHIPGSREAGVDCGVLTILQNYGLKNKSVPLFCMECYKVVVCPQSLAQVHKIEKWQADLGVACKVGAERRSYTQRGWGAYFYCRGLEESRERYKQVREWVDENLGEDIKVFIKRACTEFEQDLGASDKWKTAEYETADGSFTQEDLEKEFFEKVLEYTPMKEKQSDVSVHNTWDIWDNWDKATRPPVTYEEK